MQLMKLFESLGKDHAYEYKEAIHGNKYNHGNKFVFNKNDTGLIGYVLLPEATLVTKSDSMKWFLNNVEDELDKIREKVFRHLSSPDDWIDADDVRDDIIDLANEIIGNQNMPRELFWGGLNERKILSAIDDARHAANNPDKLLQRYLAYDANGLKVWDFKNTRFMMQYMNDAYDSGYKMLISGIGRAYNDLWLVEWQGRKFVVDVDNTLTYVELTDDEVVPAEHDSAQQDFLELCPAFVTFYHEKHNAIEDAGSTADALRYNSSTKMPFILMTPEFFNAVYLHSLQTHVYSQMLRIFKAEKQHLENESEDNDLLQALSTTYWVNELIQLLIQYDPDGAGKFHDFFGSPDTRKMYEYILATDEFGNHDLMQIFDRYLMDEHESDVEHGFFGFHQMHEWLDGGKPD